ncbi:MAG TPA: DUF503 domain-containing protein [Naasia sp.]|jgi:uncharacterized protein YlxP (DUF503 family)
MWIGWTEFDLLLGDVHSLKEKRSIVRPILADLARHHPVSAAEVGAHDLHRRAVLGVSTVGSTAAFVRTVLDDVERAVAERPEIELLSARTRLASSEDD